jgi:hypothetical protein
MEGRRRAVQADGPPVFGSVEEGDVNEGGEAVAEGRGRCCRDGCVAGEGEEEHGG